ncbi:MAG TPA: transglutaminase-like domain-containing protein, partial [Thermoanaerobaculia bacterium]
IHHDSGHHDTDHHDTGLGWPDLDRPGQRVVAKTDEALEVEVSRRRPPAGPHPFPVAATAATREYLEPNAFIQSDEPALRAKAREIVGGETDLVKAVLALERWVAESMQFDLGIAMAPSVELFQNRRGTCVGYATLLTTLARSVGIPARVVMGYVYVDGMFGGHAWVEVLVGDDWVPFDAAIVGPGSADAARFAFLATSLRDGAGEFSTGPALQMYGRIDVRILGYAVDGQPRQKIDAEARPYVVSGDLYRNAGLGIELKKPAGFRWVDLDGVWPETVLAGMAGDHGERIVLESRSRFPWEEDESAVWKALDARVPGGRHQRLQVTGRAAYWTEGDGKAAVALADGEEVWTLAAEGPEAAARLREAAAGWKM